MKRLIALLLVLLMLPAAALAAKKAKPTEAPPAAVPTVGGEIVRQFDSPTLRFSVERFEHDGARCYLTRIWMQDPGRQIVKYAAEFHKKLMYPSEMAKRLEHKAMIAVNGSGYVAPAYPQIPSNYPGRGPDYYYTPLGSLTITNGEVFRNLEGVPYVGLTLQADGLHLHVGDDNGDVLAGNPTQTWSFYVDCPLIRDGESILNREWKFANERNIRTIVGKLGEQDYFLLTVTDKTNAGLTLVAGTDFLLEQVRPDWAYNLDGGPSCALLIRPDRTGKMKTVYGNNSMDADIMAFIELPEE